jgi:flavin reductase (DIM6/NTAB) family NADH-FMN oxidoreductase RutF
VRPNAPDVSGARRCPAGRPAALAEAVLAEGAVAQGAVAEGGVAEGAVAEGGVAEGALAEEPPPAEVDRGAFMEVMAGVATPVSVVTAFNGTQPHGTTVSAFASLSLTPPMIVVALDRTSQLLACVRQARRFGVNVLASHQADLAAVFARKGDGKFAGVAWREQAGVPRIDEAGGFVACRVSEFMPGGDHVLVLGVAEVAEGQPSAPLTYHRRAFGTHAPLGGR